MAQDKDIHGFYNLWGQCLLVWAPKIKAVNPQHMDRNDSRLLIKDQPRIRFLSINAVVLFLTVGRDLTLRS